MRWMGLLGMTAAGLWGQTGLRLIADTTVRHSQPQAIGGNQGQMVVSSDAISYLEFDWQEFPAYLTKSDFRSARLRLFVNRRTRSGSIGVKSICTGIPEMQLTMWNRPVWECNGPQVQASVPETGQWLTVDVTEMLANRLQEGALSFELSSNGADVQFDSKENAGTSQPAQLIVEFALPAGARGPSGVTGVPGVTGPMGLPGPVGAPGEPGAEGFRGFRSTRVAYYWRSARASCGLGETCTQTLACREGEVIVGGGCGHRDVNDALSDIRINYNGPSIEGARDPGGSAVRAWRCSIENTYEWGSRDYEVWVGCSRRLD